MSEVGRHDRSVHAVRQVQKSSQESERPSHVILMKKWKRRQLASAVTDTVVNAVVEAARNPLAQTLAITGAILGAGKLSHDNLIVEENQADKLNLFKPNRVFLGTLTFEKGKTPNLLATPINDPQETNKINAASIAGKDPQKEEVVLINPLGLERETTSGVKTTWLQIPDVIAQGLLAKNHLTAYAALGDAKTTGSFYEIAGENENSYLLKGHEPVSKTQTQVYK